MLHTPKQKRLNLKHRACTFENYETKSKTYNVLLVQQIDRILDIQKCENVSAVK